LTSTGVQRRADQRTDWPLHFRKQPAAFHFRRGSRGARPQQKL